MSIWVVYQRPIPISQLPCATAGTSQTPHLQSPKRPPELTFIPLTTSFTSWYGTWAFALNTTEYGRAQSALKQTPLVASHEKAVGKVALRGKRDRRKSQWFSLLRFVWPHKIQALPSLPRRQFINEWHWSGSANIQASRTVLEGMETNLLPDEIYYASQGMRDLHCLRALLRS